MKMVQIEMNPYTQINKLKLGCRTSIYLQGFVRTCKPPIHCAFGFAEEFLIYPLSLSVIFFAVLQEAEANTDQR